MSQPIHYIGMDLGTFKTSVVASNGSREAMHSAVGWPKDPFARAVLGKDVVFGEDTIEKRLILNVIRPFHKGALKYIDSAVSGVTDDKIEAHKNAVKLLVKHAVELTQPEKGSKIYGVIGAPSRASIVNKRFLTEVARESFDAVAIAPEPFTVAYGMNCLEEALIVDIGAGTIDMCPIYGMYPAEEEQVTLSIGGDTVDEEFLKRVKAVYPDAEITLNMAREIKEKHGFVHDVNEKAVVELAVAGTPRQFDVTEPLKEACKMLVQPIVDGLSELIAKFDPEFRKPLLQNIILAGGGSQLHGLDRLIEQALQKKGGANVRKVYDSVFAGATGALKLAMSTSLENWNQFSGNPQESSTTEGRAAA